MRRVRGHEHEPVVVRVTHREVGVSETGGLQARDRIGDLGDLAEAGRELEKVGVRWVDTPQGHGPAGLTIRFGQTQAFRCSDPAFRPWREAADRCFSPSDAEAVLMLPRFTSSR